MNKQSSDLTVEVGKVNGAGVEGEEKMEKSVAPIELWKLEQRAGMLGRIYELIALGGNGLYSWYEACEASKSQSFSLDDWLHATVLDISKSIDDDPEGMEGLVAYFMKQQRWTHDALNEYGKLTLVEGDDGCTYLAYSDYNHKDLFILDWIQNAEELFEIIHQYPHEGAMICQEAREKLKILQDGTGSNSTESS